MYDVCVGVVSVFVCIEWCMMLSWHGGCVDADVADVVVAVIGVANGDVAVTVGVTSVAVVDVVDVVDVPPKILYQCLRKYCTT